MDNKIHKPKIIKILLYLFKFLVSFLNEISARPKNSNRVIDLNKYYRY